MSFDWAVVLTQPCSLWLAQPPVSWATDFFIIWTGRHLASITDIFGASLDSALAEPQNPITIRMFGIMLFPSTYHPLPYCCFLGKIQRRKFLGQVSLCLVLFQTPICTTNPLCFPRSGWFSLIFAKSLHLWQHCSYPDQVMEAASVSRSPMKVSVLLGI